MLYLFVPLFVAKMVVMPGMTPVLTPRLDQKYFAYLHLLFKPHSLLKLAKHIFAAMFFFLSTGIYSQPPILKEEGKINGMSFRAPRLPPLTFDMVENINDSHANWVALVPEATLQRNDLNLRPDEKNDWWGETIEANIQAILFAKKAGFKIMLKPHIVLSDQEQKERNTPISINDKTRGAKWIGDFEAKNQADWGKWERSYEAYILELAHLADSLDVELFCIGTELRQSTVKRPSYWKQLIKKVRIVYHGQLTYSANWDEYAKITFWEDLDYIGVDTYFPINKAAVPSVKKTMKNWRPILKRLKKLHKTYNRPILITEFGYRNVEYTGKRPWLHDKKNARLNNAAQSNLYQAFFQSFWEKPWVAGGFLWKWFYAPQELLDTSFSPQGKPALEVVQKWYGQFGESN